MPCLKLRKAAKDDLISIAIYTQKKWDKKQRNKYLKLIDENLEQLSTDPLLGKSCNYIRRGYRKLPVASHVIYYKITKESCVEIVRILHQRMDVGNDNL